MRVCHLIALCTQQAGEHDLPAGTRERGETWRQIAQRTTQDVSQQDVRADGQRRIGINDPNLSFDGIGDGVVMRGGQRLGIDVEGPCFARAELHGRHCEHTRAAAVVDGQLS